MSNLGVCFLNQRKPAEAEALFREALDAQLEVLGEASGATLGTIFNLAQALRAQERFEESLALARRAAEGASRVMPKSWRPRRTGRSRATAS